MMEKFGIQICRLKGLCPRTGSKRFTRVWNGRRDRTRIGHADPPTPSHLSHAKTNILKVKRQIGVADPPIPPGVLLPLDLRLPPRLPGHSGRLRTFNRVPVASQTPRHGFVGHGQVFSLKAKPHIEHCCAAGPSLCQAWPWPIVSWQCRPAKAGDSRRERRGFEGAAL